MRLIALDLGFFFPENLRGGVSDSGSRTLVTNLSPLGFKSVDAACPKEKRKREKGKLQEAGRYRRLRLGKKKVQTKARENEDGKTRIGKREKWQ